MQKIYNTIRKLGITTEYKGYYYIADAIKYTIINQNKPMMITKNIYPYISKKHNTTPVSVERDIRTSINICWENNKDELIKIAGYNLTYKPTNSQFIDMVAYYLSNEN